MNKYISLIFVGLIFIMFSCQENDDVPPVITLTGADSVTHVLNELYIDQGATAIDETDGNISSNIYIDNQVDENKLGKYWVTYKAVDEAGNEALPVSRYVRVINLGWIYMGNYLLTENQVCPNQETCQYQVITTTDSTINFRLLFNTMVCDFGQEVYADVYDATILLPYQLIQDSVSSMYLQGNGTINDSVIFIEYTKTTDTSTSLWNAEFIKL